MINPNKVITPAKPTAHGLLNMYKQNNIQIQHLIALSQVKHQALPSTSKDSNHTNSEKKICKNKTAQTIFTEIKQLNDK